MLAEDFSWLVFLSIFFIGLLIGVVITTRLSSKARHSTQVKRQLTEKELELNQVKEDVNEHFLRTAEGLAALAKQLNSLQAQLTSDAQTLANESEVSQRLGLLEKPIKAEAKEDKAKAAQLNPEDYQPPKDYSANSTGGTLSENFVKPSFEQPKDYAANSQGGTLAEDFGLNAKKDKAAKAKKKKKKKQAKKDQATQD